ncbi:MAG: hypothetical protein B6I30_07790 [Desulfobacteraceae bacterium 4572_187]|nr:MAG: hypothetical protein B6I30_07790 [Desulfobacteraceae bacterium 4572_187]
MTISHKFIQLYGQMEEAYAACKSEIESIPKEVPDREKVLEKIVQESRSMCRNPMFKLGEITVEFTPAEREDHQQWVRKTEHWKGIQESFTGPGSPESKGFSAGANT